ncbi:MAG TPA: DUF6799 domain-containing protein [Hanamia sp.]|nr:DUF6799 domain-containing protein [Hanamia sp.]
MKNLSLMVIAVAISISASAQTKTESTPRQMNKTEHNHSKWEAYMLKDGKLMLMKDGKESAVTQDVKLSDGTTISTDGKVTWKDGKTETLKTDEWIGMNGKIHEKKGMMSKK